MQFNPDSKYLYAAIFMTLVSSAYWTMFQVNTYNTFHFTSEVGYAAFPMYYYIHFPDSVHGFQYIIFQQHIAIDQWLLMPFFFFFQSSLTLMIVKAIILSLTDLLLFFITKRLTKNSLLAFAFSLAYFVNIGVVSMQLFDYHVELFILPFYLLTFYYYMKLNKRMFYLFLALLLCTLESVVSIVVALGIGLLAYEHLLGSDEHKKERIKLAYTMILSAIIAIAFYNVVYYSLQGSYASGSSANLPPSIKLLSYPLIPLTSNPGAFAQGNIYESLSISASYLAYSLLIVFLLFGMAGLLNPIPTLLFSLPWLAGVFVLQNSEFLYAWRYSFVVGGTAVGAILSYEYALKNKSRLSNFFKKIDLEIDESSLGLFIAASVVGFSLPSSLLFLHMFAGFSQLLSPTQESFLFSINQTEQARYEQINSLIALVPPNASLMTQFNIFPHMFQRRYIEIFSNETYYFQPEYILGDGSIAMGMYSNDTSKYINSYLEAHHYSVIATNVTAVLLMENSTSGR